MKRLQYTTSTCSIHGPYKDAVGSPIGCPQCIRDSDEEQNPFEEKPVMKHEDELMTFIDKSLERDLADLNLDERVRMICDGHSEAFAGIIANAVRMVGPELFRSGYLAGAKTGMEVAKAVSRQVSGHELWASRSEHRKED